MTDETIRTRAINYTHRNWRTVLHFASWSLAAIVTISVAVGHKQADREMQAKDFQSLKSEVQLMHNELVQVKDSQARTEGTLSAISLWASGMAKFQTNVQQGAADALSTPIPKGHRIPHK